jgi:hypothetical protein
MKHEWGNGLTYFFFFHMSVPHLLDSIDRPDVFAT